MIRDNYKLYFQLGSKHCRLSAKFFLGTLKGPLESIEYLNNPHLTSRQNGIMYARNYIWDTISIRWIIPTIQFQGEHITLPTLVTVPFFSKSITRHLFKQTHLLVEFVIIYNDCLMVVPSKTARLRKWLDPTNLRQLERSIEKLEAHDSRQASPIRPRHQAQSPLTSSPLHSDDEPAEVYQEIKGLSDTLKPLLAKRHDQPDNEEIPPGISKEWTLQKLDVLAQRGHLSSRMAQRLNFSPSDSSTDTCSTFRTPPSPAISERHPETRLTRPQLHRMEPVPQSPDRDTQDEIDAC